MEAGREAHEPLRSFIVHRNAEVWFCHSVSFRSSTLFDSLVVQMFGCVFKSEVRLFDISGVPLSTIRQNDFERGKASQNLSAVAMHKLRFVCL